MRGVERRQGRATKEGADDATCKCCVPAALFLQKLFTTISHPVSVPRLRRLLRRSNLTRTRTRSILLLCRGRQPHNHRAQVRVLGCMSRRTRVAWLPHAPSEHTRAHRTRKHNNAVQLGAKVSRIRAPIPSGSISLSLTLTSPPLRCSHLVDG